VNWSQALRHLPVQDIIKSVDGPMGIYEEMIRRKPNDPSWYEGGLYHDNMPFGVPSFWFVSWFDVASSPNLELFNHIRRTAPPEIAENQFLIISPVTHCAFARATEQTVVGELDVGDARLTDYDDLVYGWFDFWLKGDSDASPRTMPVVRYYTMGSNRWQTAAQWPPAQAALTPYYLTSGGGANTLDGDGRLTTEPPGKEDSPDRFAYDPENPVPSLGGNVCCTGNAIEGGSFDQRPTERRPDVLVYSTQPLKEGIEVTGFIETTLYVSSDAKDTDFTVKLIDVYPDGRAFNLDETIQRARYREGYDREVFMKKDQIYKVELTPLSTSNYFAAGHRIRIEVSSSNFPRFERNMNTGGNNFDESRGVVAHNVIHHSADYPSQIRLPIVRGAEGR
jgi:putative CocE/NonD family hydrolase